MRKRALLLIVIGVVAGAAAVIAILWSRAAAPQPVRLLPSADAFVYLDLRPLRTAGVQMPAVPLEAEYEQFVRETGFQFERDLDEAAFAVHVQVPMQSAAGEAPTRYSEVFVARFDAAKVSAYLRKLSSAVEHYRGLDIYAITLPGRTLRVAILSAEMVAASNTEGPYVIQGIIDRYKEMTPASGPELVRKYYRDVPLGSVAWAITQMTASGAQGNSVFLLPGGYELFFPAGTVMVAALRYVGTVQLKTQAFTGNDEQARRVSDQLSAFAAIFRSVEGAQAGGSDPDMKAFLDSIQVEQRGARVELSATIPQGFLKKLVAETPGLGGVAPAPSPAPEKKKPARRHKRRR